MATAGFAAVSALHPALWTGDDFPSKHALVQPLTTALRERLLGLVDRHLADATEPWRRPRAFWRDPMLEAALAPLAREVRAGRGFALLGGLPVDRLRGAALKLAVWIVGAQFGEGQSQSNLGDRIGEVTDVTDADPHARGYRSARALKPHTDICDMIALVAVRPARSGGVSRIASAHHVHERLRAERPDLLERLYHGERYHRRGEEAPGDEPVTPHRIPVFSVTDGLLNFRFVRPYMEHALRTEGREDALLVEAFDEIERIAEKSAFAFQLEPGELLLLNNLTTLHARTAVTDWPERERRRLLLRLWLNEPGFRPQAPELHLYGSGDGIPHVPGRTASYANFY